MPDFFPPNYNPQFGAEAKYATDATGKVVGFIKPNTRDEIAPVPVYSTDPLTGGAVLSGPSGTVSTIGAALMSAREHMSRSMTRKATSLTLTTSVFDNEATNALTVATRFNGTPINWSPINSNGTNVGYSGSPFKYHGFAKPVINGAAYPDYLYVKFTQNTYAVPTSNAGRISFMHDGQKLAIKFKGVTGSMLIKVNDEYISVTPQIIANDGALNYYFVDFGTADTRRIDVIGYNIRFGGVATEQTGSIYPAATRGPRVCIVGDSFTEGSGVTTGNVDGYVTYLQDLLGWDDVFNCGQGGTGYVGGGAGYRFGERLGTDVVPYDPQIVLFVGMTNDLAQPAATVGAAAQSCFQYIRQNLPNAVIAVGGVGHAMSGALPLAAAHKQGLTVLAVKDAIKAAAIAANAPFFDFLELPLNPLQVADSVTLTSSPAAGATTFNVSAPLTPGATYKFPDGSKFVAKTAGTSGSFTVTVDTGGINTAQTAGAVITQCGDSFWTGTGRVGATSGYGNCDVLVSADGQHPSSRGHGLIGRKLAELICDAWK